MKPGKSGPTGWNGGSGYSPATGFGSGREMTTPPATRAATIRPAKRHLLRENVIGIGPFQPLTVSNLSLWHGHSCPCSVARTDRNVRATNKTVSVAQAERVFRVTASRTGVAHSITS